MGRSNKNCKQCKHENTSYWGWPCKDCIPHVREGLFFKFERKNEK